MNTPEKDLLLRALGNDEPPALPLDLQAIAAVGARRYRRRRHLAAVAAVCSVLVIAGMVTASIRFFSPPAETAVAGQDSTASSPLTTAISETSDAAVTVPDATETVPDAIAAETAQTAQSSIVTEAPTNPDLAYCYRTADLASPDPTQNVGMVLDRGNVAAYSIEFCQEAWEQDRHGWRAAQREVDGTDPMPASLIACTIPAPGGEAGTVVAVFPGTEQTCASMGVPVAPLND